MHTGVRKILCLHKILRQLASKLIHFFLMLFTHLIFAQNFEATSIKVDSFIFSYATHLTFAQNFEATKVE